MLLLSLLREVLVADPVRSYQWLGRLSLVKGRIDLITT